MGAMKAYLSEIGDTLHRQDHLALREEFNNSDAESKIWLIQQMCALRTGYDGETGMFTLDHEPELSDGFFIGGEGIHDERHWICFDCFAEYRHALALRPVVKGNWLHLKSFAIEDLEIKRYNAWEHAPVASIPNCSCGNVIWVKTGHDVLFEQVAKKRIDPEVATAFMNRSFSHNLDTRAYGRDWIGEIGSEWEELWQD